MSWEKKGISRLLEDEFSFKVDEFVERVKTGVRNSGETGQKLKTQPNKRHLIWKISVRTNFHSTIQYLHTNENFSDFWIHM